MPLITDNFIVQDSQIVVEYNYNIHFFTQAFLFSNKAYLVTLENTFIFKLCQKEVLSETET